jgi:TldD protein
MPSGPSDSPRRVVDADFTVLALDQSADAALVVGSQAGAEHVEVHVTRVRHGEIELRDSHLEGTSDTTVLGLSVRVVKDGVWGFAAGDGVTADSARALAERALAMAELSRPMAVQRVVLAPEPGHGVHEWVSSYEIDPFDVPSDERIALLRDQSAQLLADSRVQHVDTAASYVKEQKFYADSVGTRTTQQRLRIQAEWEAVSIDDFSGEFESMRTCAPPVGRGWEYLHDGQWNWSEELSQLPELLYEKLRAPSIEPGRYDLVIDPTNLWLTIHESVGHATELDRALGYEANYAGTSFATLDLLGSLQYGSSLMHVTGDRVAPHGLSTVGFDDEGVAAQEWDLIRDGILVGYQVDRATAGVAELPRSNGCAFADGPHSAPIQRMPNVSLQPDPLGPDTAGLIAGVEDGIYLVGDNSWSIDMARYNFQFTAQRFYRIKSGRLAGQVRDVAYQSRTPDFWRSLVALGGPATYLLAGANNCGKAQPEQAAPVSHGAPTAVFAHVNVLNTRGEAGR